MSFEPASIPAQARGAGDSSSAGDASATGNPRPGDADCDARGHHVLVRPFPLPGSTVALAYQELHLAENGPPTMRRILGRPIDMPRPWDPPTCRDPILRRQLWTWLDHVVTWVNQDYSWDIGTNIRPCWPAHPDVVHEVALLADRRYRAAQSLTSDLLEDWHRHSLPAFVTRLRSRSHSPSCAVTHDRSPSRTELIEHLSSGRRQFRTERFERDLHAAAQETHDLLRPGSQHDLDDSSVAVSGAPAGTHQDHEADQPEDGLRSDRGSIAIGPQHGAALHFDRITGEILDENDT